MPTIKREQWSRHFGKWFRHVLIDAEIMDYRYPIKGMAVWLPYGFKIRRNILQVIRDLLDKTGHQEMHFPLLIPETAIAKESEHIKRLEGEMFWVTRGGLTPLKIKYALRPTSETAIAPMLKLWIRSHADLPIKLYQIVNIFRYETRATRPLIRMREVDNFKEAHTAHATLKEAEEQVREGVEIYKKFFDTLGVPYKTSKRPEWDKFAGAVYSIAFDVIAPDGRTIQAGTVHNLGRNFSKAFDITFETEKGSKEHVWQTCYGLSGRPVVAMLSAHGDDNGAVLPPTIAPTQVVIIPIPHKELEKQINKTCETVASKLKATDISVELDQRPDLTPGSKYYYWELRGVPVRVEIGPRDVKQKQVTVVRRDTLEKQTCKTTAVVRVVKQMLKSMMDDMRRNAWQWMNEHVYRVNSLEEAKRLLKRKAGIVEVAWCGREACGHKLEEDVNASVLGTPTDLKEKVKGKCVVCGKEAENIIRAAIAY
ncbi:MAG: proline--tRNA ligase [Candidatus Bathyarchaeota archaeon]|nr:proline--tRNA ligase [Candidatus Bathyarchaeota archaeon]